MIAKRCKGLLLEPMYRGSRTGAGPKGPSYFSSSEIFAKTYGPVSTHRLCLQKPLEVPDADWPQYASGPWNPAGEIAAAVKERGYDSVINKRQSPGGEITTVFVVDAKKAVR
jgi:hypothetical protein